MIQKHSSGASFAYTGRTAVITGGVSGMGRATADLLAAGGASVIVTGRSDAALQAASEHFAGTSVDVIRSDASSLSDIGDLTEQVGRRFDGLDLLFLNAGVPKPTPAADVTPEAWDELFGINVRGPFFTATRLLPHLRRGSSIVVTTTMADQMGLAGLSAYGASKAALRSLVRTLAREFAAEGIRVNAVSPGPIETPMVQKLGMPEEALDGHHQRTAAENPMGRWGTADEIARAVAFLAFDATYTTGSELPVDGGLTQL